MCGGGFNNAVLDLEEDEEMAEEKGFRVTPRDMFCVMIGIVMGIGSVIVGTLIKVVGG